MAVDRPTFHESWYRVSQMKPRLHPSVQTYRQHFRGQPWFVLRDPVNNQHFRLSEPAYYFVGLLDGRRTIGEAWDLANERLEDAAPTQGEVIQTLGQLYASNLLVAELPPDAEGMFARYRKRVNREVRGYLTNLLFIRIPLFDPDRFLDRWHGLFGWLFGPIGIALWAVLLATAGYFLVGRIDEFWQAGKSLISQQYLMQVENVLLLYLCFAGIKAVHEFGHGFACKRFGQQNGSGGEVHTIGIMFLVFMPVPYVDASSSWAFRSKWHRAFVGAAGMYVELAAASIAAIVWAHTSAGSLVHEIAFNLTFIAGVSTILFNGNPLLRYDGYYILSDLLEIPNLYQRSKEYLYYLVKKFAFGVRRPRNPAHGTGERVWLPVYGVASFIYRVFILTAILLFVANAFFTLGLVLAIAAIITWVFVPLGKFVHYLAVNPELMRVRSRATGVVLGFIALLVVALGLIPFPQHGRTEGLIEPTRFAIVYMNEDGFVERVLPTGAEVEPDGAPLVHAENEPLRYERQSLAAMRNQIEARLRKARREDVALAQALQEQVDALDQQIARIDERLANLDVRAPFAGEWVGDELDRVRGAYLRRGEPLGAVVDTREMIVRATADQYLGPRIAPEVGVGATVEMRVKGRPDLEVRGRIVRIHEAASRKLPSPALSFAAGGSVAVDPQAEGGDVAAEPVFELRLEPLLPDGEPSPLRGGQRVIVRMDFPPEPLALQWWRSIRQLVQQRFQI